MTKTKSITETRLYLLERKVLNRFEHITCRYSQQCVVVKGVSTLEDFCANCYTREKAKRYFIIKKDSGTKVP